MKRIGNLLKKDIILGIKDVYILLEVGFSVMIMLMLLFIIPKDIEQEASIYIYDAGSVLEARMNTQDAQKSKKSGQIFVENREEVIAGMTKNKSAVGMILSKNADNRYQTELLTQPYTTDAMVNFFRIQMSDLLSMIIPPGGTYPSDVYDSVKVIVLQEGARDEIPFNKRLTPIILMFMVGLMGMFAMISLIGQERSDATIRAYKVTPAHLWEFILSKHLMLLMVGMVTFSILYIPVIGFSGYLSALLIMILTIFVGSGIGVLLGSFFDNPMSGIGWTLLLMIVFGLPAVSLFAPVFSPDWMKFIPSYHTLFGLDAAMFPDHNSHVFWNEVGILFIIATVLLAFSGWVFTKRLRKDI